MLTFLRVQRKAVEAETITQQVRKETLLALAFEVRIKLVVYDRQLVASKHPSIFVQRTKRIKIKEKASPDVGTDQRKVAPLQAHPCSKSPLQGSHRALARRGCTLGDHEDRPFLGGQLPEALFIGDLSDFRMEKVPDSLATIFVAG
jgi:hypothetical protein